MKKLPTVTIGIPAYNEEANIKHLLKALFRQKNSSYSLERIIVVSDGSSDRTEEFVRSMKSRRILLLTNKSRLGLNATQNKILRKSKSDILILFDADVLPKDKNCIASLISPLLSDSQVGLTSGKLYAIRTMRKPIGRIIANAHEMNRHIFEQLPESNNVYLCAGRMRAFSRSIYRKLRWPEDVPEDAYSYFFAKSNGFKFVYVSKAICYFHPPTTLEDHIKQNKRFISGKEALRKYFDDYLLRREYELSLITVLRTTLIYIWKRPFSIPSYLLLMFYISFFINRRTDDQSRYEISISSKKIDYEKIQ